MTLKRTLPIGILLLLIPGIAGAYLNPEEVLMSEEFAYPPEARGTDERVGWQAATAAERRQREQDAAFALQHPEWSEEPEIAPEPVHASAPELTIPAGYALVPIQGQAPQAPSQLDAANMELLRAMRLLSRVNENQTVMQHLQNTPNGLHAGAPLPPTGPGAVLTALTMLGAFAWTFFRAKRAERMTMLG